MKGWEDWTRWKDRRGKSTGRVGGLGRARELERREDCRNGTTVKSGDWKGWEVCRGCGLEGRDRRTCRE